MSEVPAIPRRPRTAFVIPVFRAQDDLDRTLESLDAERGDFDVIVVDDGSEPAIRVDTRAWKRAPHLIRLARNSGIEMALNAGVEYALAQGYTFIARQDAGDLDLPGRVEAQEAFLDAHPDVAVVGTWVKFADPQGKEIFTFSPPTDTGTIRRRMKYGPAFIHPSVMMRASALKEAGIYRLGYPRAEDYELLYRLARRYDVANLGEVLVIKEENPASLSNAKRRHSLRSRLRVQLKNFTPFSPHSYLGLAYTLALYLTPYSLILALKAKAGAVK